MSLTDDPIRKAVDDLFGRTALAENLADLLLSFPADSSYRLGIYGEWGSGKTSVLQLVENKLRAEGHAVVWLLPWALGSSDAVLDRLLGKL